MFLVIIKIHMSINSLSDFNNKVFLAKLLEKKEIARDTFSFVFKTEKDFIFKPGQYVWVELFRLIKDDLRGERRAFSIANIPNEENKIEIIFRKSDSVFNESLRSLTQGNELNIIGPNGFSFCLPSGEEDLVLISGGTGVVPFLSLLRFAFEQKIKNKIFLVYADTSPDRFLYKEEMESCQSENIKVSFVEGQINFQNIQSFVPFKDKLFYVSGRQEFVDYINNILIKNGVFEHQIIFEQFHPNDPLDSELSSIFENGRPKINIEESDFIKERANVLYSLVEASSNHILITDTNGKILYANFAAQKITGFSIEEMLGNTPRLWGGLMSKEFYKNLWESKNKGISFDTEVVNRRKNGELYVARAHISAVRNKKGQVIGFIASEEDVTSLYVSEEKSRLNEERFRQLTEKIAEVYWIIELNPERIVYVSPSFEDIWGVKREELYSNNDLWMDFVHKEDVEKVNKSFDNLKNGIAEYELDYRVVNKDGKVFILKDKGERVLDEKGNLIRLVGVARDVTKERMIDKEKTEFVSLASHQLKTPIGSINWDLEMLLAGDYGEITTKQKEVMQSMYTMTFRMRELVDNLLKVSRLDMGILSIEAIPYDLKKLADEVLMELDSYLVTKKHKIIKSYQEDLPVIAVDPSLMLIIMQNFLTNAIKYTPKNGEITVSLKKDLENIIFSVSNNGEPIPKEEQSKIFQKMFRASNAEAQDPDGNGLGLYIVKEIAIRSGGNVWFESGEGKDTTFYVSFPLSGMKNFN